MRALVLCSVALAVLGGCGASRPAAPAPSSSRSDALTTQNGINENGISENGISENGQVLNGMGENGISENGISENGMGENGMGENGRGENGRGENGRGENGVKLSGILVSVDLSAAYLPNRGLVVDTHLDASDLVGHAGATSLSSADYVGAYFTGTTGRGKTAAVRITAHKMQDAPNNDLHAFLVEWRASNGKWNPMCSDAQGNALYAVPVYGYWDYTRGTPTGGSKTESTTKITFACPNGAIGKCIDWGYRPWESVGGVSLAPYHQACTRLTRADYCGDGTPHTVNGSFINLYDNLGVQVDTESWVFEAQWSPAGATCLATVGSPSTVSCYAQLAAKTCNADDPSAMLSTETPHGVRAP